MEPVIVPGLANGGHRDHERFFIGAHRFVNLLRGRHRSAGRVEPQNDGFDRVVVFESLEFFQSLFRIHDHAVQLDDPDRTAAREETPGMPAFAAPRGFDHIDPSADHDEQYEKESRKEQNPRKRAHFTGNRGGSHTRDHPLNGALRQGLSSMRGTFAQPPIRELPKSGS